MTLTREFLVLGNEEALHGVCFGAEFGEGPLDVPLLGGGLLPDGLVLRHRLLHSRGEAAMISHKRQGKS